MVCGTVQKNTKAKVRSAKFLRAVASGKWVVTEAWLQECKRRSGRVKEEPFEVSGDRKSVVPSAPTRSRLAHADPVSTRSRCMCVLLSGIAGSGRAKRLTDNKLSFSAREFGVLACCHRAESW